MTHQGLNYTGLNILQALEDAHRYNALVTNIISDHVTNQRKLIDFGAGTGTFAKLLQARGHEIICIETDSFLRAELSGKGFKVFSNLHAIPDESCEFVFSLNVLEHIADDTAVIETLYAKLQSGGRLLIYVPAFELLWTSLDDKVEHYRRYARSSLKSLVRDCGFRVKRCRYVDSLGFIAVLLFKVFGNKQGDLSPVSIRLYDRFLVPVTRICDLLFQYVCGKNIYIVCDKQ